MKTQGKISSSFMDSILFGFAIIKKVREIYFAIVKWIQVAQDKFQCWAFVFMVRSILVL